MIEQIKHIAAQIVGEVAKTGCGLVTDYDPTIYAVRVQMQPTGEVTGWMPIGAIWSGNNFGLVVGPNIGDMVRVDYLDGDRQVAMMGAKYFNDTDQPPQVPSGEMWAIHSTGSSIKITNDGKVTITDKAGSVVVMNGDGTGAMTFASGLTVNANVQVNGSIVASQNISDLNGAHGSISSLRTAYDGHTHSGVQTGTGTTSGPSATV